MPTHADRPIGIDRLDVLAGLGTLRLRRVRRSRRGLPGYADGGYVDGAPRRGSGGGGRDTLTLGGGLSVALAPGLVAAQTDAYLQTQDGERRVLAWVERNQGPVRRALGV